MFGDVTVGGAIELNDSILYGVLDMIAGSGAVMIKGTQILAQTPSHYCVKISSVGAYVTIQRGYLKGASGSPAILWNGVAANNVKIKRSEIFHGSMGANNPFGQTGVLVPINYRSHHSTYNSDPTTGGLFVNLIAIAQRFDCIDVNADY